MKGHQLTWKYRFMAFKDYAHRHASLLYWTTRSLMWPKSQNLGHFFPKTFNQFLQCTKVWEHIRYPVSRHFLGAVLNLICNISPYRTSACVTVASKNSWFESCLEIFVGISKIAHARMRSGYWDIKQTFLVIAQHSRLICLRNSDSQESHASR